MSIKLDIKTSVVDTNAKVDTADLNGSKYTNDTAEVEALLEDMPGMEGLTSSHEYTGFDDYMCGDMNPEAIQETTVSIQNIRNLPPSLDDIIAMNPLVRRNLGLARDFYVRTEEKINELIDYFKDIQFTGQCTADEAARISQKIEEYLAAASRCKIGAQQATDMLDSEHALYSKEFRLGDLNGDNILGDPNSDNCLGVHTLENGRKIYINPTTGVAYNHPPYADLDYEPILGRGYEILDREAPDYTSPLGIDDEGNQIATPTTDLEIYVSDFNALEGAAFGTAAELMGVQYFWVKADGDKSFEPKLAFQPDQTDSDTDTEPHYEIAGFEKVGDQIVQKKPPEDEIQNWVQVECGETVVTSKEVDGGRGYAHFIEYYSADASRTLIARICIRETKVDSQIPTSTSELYALMPDNFFEIDKESKNWSEYVLSDEEQVDIVNEAMTKLGLSDNLTVSEWSGKSYTERKAYLMSKGEHKVYASSSPVAFNTDNIYSYTMKVDFSGLRSTARLAASLEQLEQALNLTRPDPSDEKAFRAYIENLSAFTDTTQMWAFHANRYRSDHSYDTSSCDQEWDWDNDAAWLEIERHFESGGYASVYIDPSAPEAQAQVFNHFGRDGSNVESHSYEADLDFINLPNPDDNWNDGERPVTETMTTQVTGALTYGKGRIGHGVGSQYNDAWHIAEKNARLEEIQEKFAWAEPIMPESASNNTVIECGTGNDIVRGYDANHYITDVTMAVIDGGGTSDNYIEAQASTAMRGTYLTNKPDWRASKRKYDRTQEQYMLDINAKHYIHVDAGGTVGIDTHWIEENSSEIIDGEWNPSGDGNPFEDYYKDDAYDVRTSTNVRFGDIEDPDAVAAMPSGLAEGSNSLGKEGEVRELAFQAAEELETERQHVEIPDYIESVAKEWVEISGSGAYAEMKGEVNDFFGNLSGEMENIWNEYASDALGDDYESLSEEEILNTTV